MIFFFFFLGGGGGGQTISLELYDWLRLDTWIWIWNAKLTIMGTLRLGCTDTPYLCCVVKMSYLLYHVMIFQKLLYLYPCLCLCILALRLVFSHELGVQVLIDITQEQGSQRWKRPCIAWGVRRQKGSSPSKARCHIVNIFIIHIEFKSYVPSVL